MKTDEQLFAAYVAGDDYGLAQLMARYRDPVQSYLTGKGLQHADADIAFQQVFIRIVNNKEQFTRDKALKPWIYTIANELCRDRLAANRQAARMLATPEMEVLAETYAK